MAPHMALHDELTKLISFASSSSKIENELEVRRYIEALNQQREKACAQVSSTIPAMRLKKILGFSPEFLMVDAGLFVGIGNCLQKVLVSKLREQDESKALTQVASYTIVDLWGKLEASRALLFALGRILSEEADIANHQVSLRAHAEVLVESLKDTLLDMLKNLGAVDSFSFYAPVLDWMMELTRSAEYELLHDSISKEVANL